MNTIDRIVGHNLANRRQIDDEQPQLSTLCAISRRIEQITASVSNLHRIADRACGENRSAEGLSPHQQHVPNGMLDEIEHALDDLVELSRSAVARLSRIA